MKVTFTYSMHMIRFSSNVERRTRLDLHFIVSKITKEMCCKLQKMDCIRGKNKTVPYNIN